MLMDKRGMVGEEYRTCDRRVDRIYCLAHIRRQYLGQQVALLDILSDIAFRVQDTRLARDDSAQHLVSEFERHHTAVHRLIDYTLSVKETQYAEPRLFCEVLIDDISRAAVYAKRLSIEDLPVIVEQCCVVRLRFVLINKRQSEALSTLQVLVASIHHPDVRHEITIEVIARELNTIFVAPYGLEKSGSYSLCSLALVISREHTVDIRVIHGPKALMDIQRIRIDGRNDKDAYVWINLAFTLKSKEVLDQLRADEKLLHLVASHSADDSYRLVAIAEIEPRYAIVISKR